MLVAKAGAPIAEPGALATGVVGELEALASPLLIRPADAFSRLRGLTPPAPMAVLALAEEKALPPPVPPLSALAGGVALGAPESETCEPGLCDGRVSGQSGSSSEGSGGGMPCRLTINALVNQVQGEAVLAGLLVD